MTPTLTERVERAIARATPSGITAEAAATGVLSGWRPMFNVLTPVIGEGGVTALFLRTCNITRPETDWASSPGAGLRTIDGLEHLSSMLLDRTVDEIRTANHQMLSTFITTLASLIGPVLTEHLLGLAWPETVPERSDGNTTP
jgi:hypothetical protein